MKKITSAGQDRNLLSEVSRRLHRSGKIEKFSPKQWEEEKKTYFEGKCAYCGGNGKLVREHIIPTNRFRLGLHQNGNVVPACNKCNNRKKKYDETSDNGYGFVEFCKEKGYNTALAKIRQYMKNKGYRPFTDKAMKEEIKKLMEDYRKKLGRIKENYAEKIKEIMEEMIK